MLSAYSTYYAGVGGVKLWDFDGEPNYKEGELIALNDLYDVPRDGNEVAAPSLYEAQKWLREEKDLHIEVRWYCNMWYEYEVKEAEGKVIAEGSAFKTYEEALSTAVYMATEHVKEKEDE